MKTKIGLSILIIMLVLAASLGATLAWFTAESEAIINKFTAGTVLISAEENVSEADEIKMENWNPGDCVEKEFIITNDGTKKIVLRTDALAAVSGTWYSTYVVEGDQDNVIWDPVPLAGGVEPVTITVESDDWEQLGDYYYYSGIIPSGESVELTIKVCLRGAELTNDYQGKIFVMKNIFYAIQSSNEASNDAWGVYWDVDGEEWKAVVAD